MEKKNINLKTVLIIYQIVYVAIMLVILPMLSVSELVNAAFTAFMTVASALLIGATFVKERNEGRGRQSLAFLSMCALVTVYVLYECGLYS